MSDIKKNIICLGWSIPALIGLVKYLKIGVENYNFSNNIIYAAFFIMIFVMVKQSIVFWDKRKASYALVFSVCMSFALVVGAQIEYYRAMLWNGGTILKGLFLTMFIFPLVVLLIHFCEDTDIQKCEICKIKITKIRIFAVLIVFWGLAYIALFPGIYDYDSINQTLQFLVTGEITAHHPVIHSFILSSFLKIGKSLFGSYELGLGIYSFLQMCFLAYVAVEVTWSLHKKKRYLLFILSACFYAVFPLHYIMSVWATKDVIFTGFFVLLSLSFITMADEETQFWNSKNEIFKYMLYVLLMCMFRNNGVYALLFMLIVGFFCVKKYRKKLVMVTIIPIGIYFLYQNVLLPSAGVMPGNMREMLSIPCQQMAKVYVETPDVYTESEKEDLFRLIPEENLKNYEITPMIADSTKNYFDSEEFKSDIKKYSKLYLNIAVKSPRKYIEAFMQNSLGFWYPNKSYPDARLFHPYVEFDMADPNLFKGDYIYLKRMSGFSAYEDVLRNIMIETSWKNYPVISNFFVPGTYFWLLCFSIIIVLYRKKYNQLLVLSFWSGLWITLLISPVALVRYAYPIIFCLPLMGEVMFDKNREKITIQKEKREYGKDCSFDSVL